MGQQSEINYTNLRKHESVIPYGESTTKDLISLFLYGKENQAAIKESVITENNDYYIFRRKIKDLDFDLKSQSCVIVHSKLANGKTMFCLGALEYLNSLGYTIFTLENNDITTQEIELLKKENKPLLFIENYHRHLHSLKLISSINSDSIKILLTSRTELHEIYIENIFDLGWSSFEIDVNYLTSDDIEKLIAIMSTNGLFGEKSNLSLKHKQKLLNRDCRREMSLILGEILKAPQITERINELLKLVNINSELEECLLACSISSYLGHELDSLDIQTLTSARGIDGIKYLKNETTSQILEKNNKGLVVLKNPVLAKHIINKKNQENSKLMLDFLVGFYGNLNKYSSGEQKYEYLMKDINIFSNLLKIFGHDNCGLINEFYDRVRLYSDNSKNHHFWLQFAIAKLSIKEYDEAQRYIDTTISLAKNKNYNYDWVNCQYARLVIETAELLEDKNERIIRLRHAHSLIINQENRHYPFRVACGYIYFIQNNQRSIDIETKKEIAKLLREFDAKYYKTISNLRNKEHPVMIDFKNKITQFFKSNPNL